MANVEESRPDALPQPTALIVCALQLEFRALKQHLATCYEEVDDLGNVFDVGLFNAGICNWRVVLAECGAGNIAASQMVAAGISQFDPEIVFFSGIAGSLKSDVPLGHVVASTKIICYPQGRADETFKPRFDVATCSHRLVQRARATARSDAWCSRIHNPSLLVKSPPKAIVGPIAAGEQVIASDRSFTYGILKEFCSDAIAVEMEGYGTVACATMHGTDAIVVRAISDNVVDKADCDGQGWQPIAAEHAAAFLYEMLANFQPPTTRTITLKSSAPLKLSHKDTSTTDLESIQDGLQRKEDVEGDVKVAVDSMSCTLLDWEKTLPTGAWIERPEVRQILEVIEVRKSSTTVLLGPPGAGKSALLAQLGTHLRNEGVQTFAVKADLIDPNVKDSTDLANALNLPRSAADCIRIMASSGKVVMLMDQLDALANILDLHSQRLNLLLQLIRELSGIENLHIVCSSRTFEFDHDVRLTGLQADKINLQLPPWVTISQLLKSEKSIDGTNWPIALQESLRVPQYLKIFMSLLDGAQEYEIANSYQQLLDEMWNREVTNSKGPPDRDKLLMDLASQMANEESLWLPLSRFGFAHNAIRALEAANILYRPSGRSTIGFRHQTLFEHALARAFASGTARLAPHVLERQNALFIRPVVWSTLRYLRETTSSRYSQELYDLCGSELRLHILYLLIDFLGQVDRPTDDEQLYLQCWLDDPALRSRVLIAIAGNEGWFKRFHNTHLPVLMELPRKDVWPVVVLLRSALPFAREECLSLVREHWLGDKSLDELSINVFRELTTWDEETVHELCTIVDRSEVREFYVMDIASNISATSPELAPRVIATRLQRDLRLLESEPRPEPEPIPAEASETDRIWHGLKHDPRQDYEKLLQRREGFYDLPAIAEAAPGTFLSEIWPWFIQVLEHLLWPPHHIIYTYREAHGLFDFEKDRMDEDELVHSIDNSVKLLAKTQYAEFRKFFDEWKSFDAKPVQRLLCRGLIEIAGQVPDLALEFLTIDRRRLALGDHQDKLGESRKLIRAVADHLTTDQLRTLESAVLNWSEYVNDIEGEEPSDRFSRTKWDREKRLRLLKTLPFDSLTRETQALIRSEEIALPDYRDYDHEPIGGMSFVGSPMSAEQMEKADDKHILQLFDELTDSTEAGHPRDFSRGGTVQASHEVARLAETDPQRVVSLLRQFRPEDQQTPAEYAIRALGGNAEFPTSQLFELIFELDHAGFHSADFRSAAAHACCDRANSENGLPNEICLLLEGWLDEWKKWDYFRDSEENGESNDNSRERSVLWEQGMVVYPHGTYWLLHALTYGLLRQNPPDYERWMSMLDRHVERPESIYTWKVLTEHLRYLRNYDAARATAFLVRLFERYPKVRDSHFGVVLIARLRLFIAEESYRNFIARMRDSEWTRGKQAYGELLGVNYLYDEFQNWTETEVNTWINDPEIAIGLAFAVAKLMWEESSVRHRATTLFGRLAESATDETAKALMSTFASNKTLLAHPDSRQLLEFVSENPKLLAAAPEHWFVSKLEDVVTYCPELVCKICNQFIEALSDELGDIRTSVSLASSDLVNIAMTLQRLPKFREAGLAMFERLLEYGVDDASRLLNSLDRRSLNVPQQPPRRRRSRK